MAATCASWTAGHHLSSLGGLATKLDRLEKQAALLEELQEEKDKLDLIKAYRGGQVLSEQVTELKSYISAVADAELDGDDSLLAITAAHTAAYAVQLIKQSPEPGCLPSKVTVHPFCSSTVSILQHVFFPHHA
eukprot:GHUV01053848.1.p1 GENE.GHUV01053848.1~~GHUV01053848.1.p1  ORF type:complete len:133 (+),score=41.34 GHUV01053848.1:101-499(+)